jgi:hypothetical protein
MRLSPFSLILALTLPAAAQDRAEVVNRSGRAWTLALVEGGLPRRGSLTLVDKFTGKTLATLAKAGDRVALPPGCHCLAVYNRDAGYLFLGFILQDGNGWYAEYQASVDYLSSTRLSLALVDHHLGPPLDGFEEGEVQQRLSDLLEVGAEAIVIHPDVLAPASVRFKNAVR